MSFGSGTAATGEPLGLGDVAGLGESDPILVGLGEADDVACGPPQPATTSINRIAPPSLRTLEE
jgi:hypothetical protein